MYWTLILISVVVGVHADFDRIESLVRGEDLELSDEVFHSLEKSDEIFHSLEKRNADESAFDSDSDFMPSKNELDATTKSVTKIHAESSEADVGEDLSHEGKHDVQEPGYTGRTSEPRPDIPLNPNNAEDESAKPLETTKKPETTTEEATLPQSEKSREEKAVSHDSDSDQQPIEVTTFKTTHSMETTSANYYTTEATDTTNPDTTTVHNNGTLDGVSSAFVANFVTIIVTTFTSLMLI